MNSQTTDSNMSSGLATEETAERLHRAKVFLIWCLQREALLFRNCLGMIFLPVTAIYLLCQWPLMEADFLLQMILWIAVLYSFLAGGSAAKAVSWDVSREHRDLIRLTGIDPVTLLWCKSLSLWWSILLFQLTLLPLAILASRLGETNDDRWRAAGCWLILMIVLTAGFAMIASASSIQSSNPEATAGNVMFVLMLIYHILFVLCAAVIGIYSRLTHGTFAIFDGSPEHKAMQYVLSLAPVSGLYRGFTSPSTFSPWELSYWLHYLTAALCLWAACRVMRNRFRVTTGGDDMLTRSSKLKRWDGPVQPPRPRCGDRPFFWKDIYILGGGRRSRIMWLVTSILASIGVIVLHRFPLPVAIAAVCIAPLLVLTQFDALLVREFREQTWDSLMLLPVDPMVLLVEKLRAAAWDRMTFLFPTGLAVVLGMVSNASVVLMTATIALLVGLLLVEVSIVNQLYAKSRWIGPAILGLTIVLIGILVPLWVRFDLVASFLLTVVLLGMIILGMVSSINYRLKNWSAG